MSYHCSSSARRIWGLQTYEDARRDAVARGLPRIDRNSTDCGEVLFGLFGGRWRRRWRRPIRLRDDAGTPRTSPFCPLLTPPESGSSMYGYGDFDGPGFPASADEFVWRNLVAWIIPKDVLSLGFSTLGIV